MRKRKQRMSFDETCRRLREQYGNDCWPWPGRIDHAGYGAVTVRQSSPWYNGMAHRAAFVRAAQDGVAEERDAPMQDLPRGEAAARQDCAGPAGSRRPAHLVAS
jgi:hypothetical protein